MFTTGQGREAWRKGFSPLTTPVYADPVRRLRFTCLGRWIFVSRHLIFSLDLRYITVVELYRKSERINFVDEEKYQYRHWGAAATLMRKSKYFAIIVYLSVGGTFLFLFLALTTNLEVFKWLANISLITLVTMITGGVMLNIRNYIRGYFQKGKAEKSSRKEEHLLQITETEISIPLKVHYENGPDISNSAMLFALMGGTFALCLGLGIYCLALSNTLMGFGFLFFAIFLFFTSLILALAFPMLIRGLHAGPWQLRISHEGFLYTYILPIFIRWDEITSFVLYTFEGMPTLSITVDDEMTIFTRFLELQSIHGWESTYYHFMFRMSVQFLRHRHSPFFLNQRLLPIPINELVMLIQEHFASELREHSIAVLEK